MEDLSALIHKYERAGLIQGVKVAGGTPIVSHLFFANNCFLFFKASQSEAQLIKHILAASGQGSRQLVNFNKSSISFSSNVHKVVKRKICSILEVNGVVNHGIYLGLPFLIGRSKKQVFSSTRGRVWQKL